MEPDPSTPPADPPRTDWRALAALRDRVETAAREIERLRTENAALAQRLVEIENQPEATRLPVGDDPEALKTRIDGFIGTIDDLLRAHDAATDA